MEYIKIEYTDPIYPKKLLQIDNYPKELYILGNYELLNKQQTVAIIGSRDCTEYGRKHATYFAQELSKEGICVISGMAIGIDTCAHIGAVENEGRTIAVLGGGFNKIYPKENEWLFHKILANNGCIITEHEPNVEADKRNFPKRNRIVSALSEVTLVIEAEYRSGTAITVGYAKKQRKIVCCLPSNIDSRCGIGTNIMLQEGAKLITKPNEIVEIVKDKNINIEKVNNMQPKNKSTKIKKTVNSKQNEKIKKEIPKEYEEIYNIIGNKQLHINEICRISKKTMKEITTVLTMLELEDFIEQLPGNRFKVKEE